MKSYPVRDYKKPLEGSLLEFFFLNLKKLDATHPLRNSHQFPASFWSKAWPKFRKGFLQTHAGKNVRNIHSWMYLNVFPQGFGLYPQTINTNPQNSLQSEDQKLNTLPCGVGFVQENAEFQKVIAEQRQTQKLLKEAFLGCCWMIFSWNFLRPACFFCDFRCYVIHTSIYCLYMYNINTNYCIIYIYICILSYIILYIYIHIIIYTTQTGREGIFMSVSGVSWLVKNVSYCHMCTSTYIAHTFFA